MPQTGTWQDFPGFYANPAIVSIAYKERWTISDSEKRPVDMGYLTLDPPVVKFAKEKCRPYLVTLPEVMRDVPDAANHAFWLDSTEDGIVVLDVEKTCPDDVKAELLKMPYIYGETSMSGKGLHLIFPLPHCLFDYNDAALKAVMKERHGWYEILLEHYVTFTRNMIQPADPNADPDSFVRLFESMCRDQKPVSTETALVEPVQPADIPYGDDIIRNLLIGPSYRKTRSDFPSGSEYETGCSGFYYNQLNRMIQTSPFLAMEHDYTDNEKAWLIYQVTKTVLPHRSKHDRNLGGLPWLLSLAQYVITNSKVRKDGDAP